MSLIDRLRDLVAFDTQNPSGDERPMADALARALGALGAAQVERLDVAGHASVYARFGAAPPRVLLNAHLDTVPANSGYGGPPHVLRQVDGRLVALGAADTKGAIAAVLEALAQAPPVRPVAVLFSGDEELGGSSIRHFLRSPLRQGLERAVVCEPTGCRVGARHRGVGAARATVASPGGHSSRADELIAPIALLARAGTALDDLGREHRGEGPQGFTGLCLNVASIDGGVAFNVIPTGGTLTFSVRPGPGVDVAQVLAEAQRRIRAAVHPVPVAWDVAMCNPSFGTRDLPSFRDLLGEAAVSAPIDLAFWTEAALLSEAGIDAVVFGPGHIEQAHAADEYVTLEQLERAREAFFRLLKG